MHAIRPQCNPPRKLNIIAPYICNADAAKDESLALLELMASSGVLDQEVVSNILDEVSEEAVGTPLSNIEGEGSESPDIEVDVIDIDIIDEE